MEMLLDLQQSAQLHHTEAETQTDRQISQITEGASVWQLWATKCWTTRQKVQWNRAENSTLTSGNCCFFMVSPDLKCCLKCSYLCCFLKPFRFTPAALLQSSLCYRLFVRMCTAVLNDSEMYRDSPFLAACSVFCFCLLQETGPISKIMPHGFRFGKKEFCN